MSKRKPNVDQATIDALERMFGMQATPPPRPEDRLRDQMIHGRFPWGRDGRNYIEMWPHKEEEDPPRTV